MSEPVARYRRMATAVLSAVVLAAVSGCSEAPRKPNPGPARSGPGLFVPPFGRSTVEDSSGEGNHGIVRGGTARGVPGHRGTAYGFDEPGSWVEVPTDPSLDPGGRDFMVSAWIRVAHAPRPHETFDIVRKGLSHSETGMYKLELVSDGRARCSAKDTERRQARVTSKRTGLADGAWHQVGCARIGSTWGVVVDGVATFERAALGVVANKDALSIGSKYGIEDSAHGVVDDVLLVVGRPRSIPMQPRGRDQRVAQLQRTRPVGRWLLNEDPEPRSSSPMPSEPDFSGSW